MMLKINNKAKTLAALYNNARTQGLGAFFDKSEPMTEQEADRLLKNQTNFDYHNGRIMKVDLKGDEFDPWLYDRDNGEGAAERALAE